MSEVRRYTFHAAERDWLRAMEQASRGSRVIRLFYVWAALLLGALLWSSVRGGSTLAGALRTAWPAIAVLGGIMLFLRPLSRLSARAGMRLNRNIVGEKTLELDAAGLRWLAPEFNADVPWSRVRRVWEAPDYFFFRQSTARTFFLPKAGLATGELADLREFLRQHAGRAAGGLAGETAPRAG